MEHTHEHTLATDSVLTPAETRIASGYVSGLIGKEIANAAGISYNTVVKHTQNIYDKTGIKHSTNALVAWFLSENFRINLEEFSRRLVAFALFLIMGAEAVYTDLGSQLVRRYPSRRVETRARRGRTRRGRREDEYYIPGLDY
jgi:DNA-binding CsgD family transcriptional regulator